MQSKNSNTQNHQPAQTRRLSSKSQPSQKLMRWRKRCPDGKKCVKYWTEEGCPNHHSRFRAPDRPSYFEISPKETTLQDDSSLSDSEAPTLPDSYASSLPDSEDSSLPDLDGTGFWFGENLPESFPEVPEGRYPPFSLDWT